MSAAVANVPASVAAPFAEAARTWARVALLSFGGPAGQIAVMHRILVEEKRWIGEERFLHALNFCMLLPGPEAQQLATYIGWLMHGTRGGLVAGGLFVLPGFLAIMAFSIVYALWGYHPLMAGLFLGLKAAVVALIVQAILRIGRRALRSGLAIAIAVLAFVAIFLLRAPFPLIILAAAAFGYLWTRSGRTHLLTSSSHGTSGPAPPKQPVLDESLLMQVKPSARRALTLLAIWLPLWFAPLLALALMAGPHHVFTEVGVFFSKMAVVTFGGAYAVLAYVGQEAAQNYHWLSPSQMLDGLGLAESTPGPLIMVVQFVGFLAAYQTPGIERPMLAAIFTACITVWVTFVPCFLWIFLGAPYVESLRQNKALSGALAAITAAVVGVIANLALWFALHALFAEVDSRTVFGRLILDVPKLASLSWPLLMLMSLAFVMTFVLKWSLARMLVLCALLGVGYPLAWAGERPSAEQAAGAGAPVRLLLPGQSPGAACRGGSGGVTGHTTTLLGGMTTCSCTLLAMFHLESCALLAATVADPCTQSADVFGQLAPACHVADSYAADRCAVDVERHTTCHRRHVMLGKTCNGAVITSIGAGVACFNTGSILLESHEFLLR